MLVYELQVHTHRYTEEASDSMTAWARSVNEEIRREKLNGSKGERKGGRVSMEERRGGDRSCIMKLLN